MPLSGNHCIAVAVGDLLLVILAPVDLGLAGTLFPQMKPAPFRAPPPAILKRR